WHMPSTCIKSVWLIMRMRELAALTRPRDAASAPRMCGAPVTGPTCLLRLVRFWLDACQACHGGRSNGIVEADELARQYSAAGCNSYRNSVVKVLDGLAA